MNYRTCLEVLVTVCILVPLTTVKAEEDDLAKKLANPVASLISIPFQYNYDEGYGPGSGAGDEGSRHVVNVQPVVPISINDEFNVISRTILPLVDQHDIPAGDDEAGIGDVTQSFFFSPKEPTSGGLIWGVGPVVLLPTASDELLGGEKWGTGPTFVALTQAGPWTVGALGNHIWSFAGVEHRRDVNTSFLQPFLSYITDTKTTFALNTETTYDWQGAEWAIPVNFVVSQLLKIGNQPVQIGAGPRYWAEGTDGGADGWGARAVVTLLFPK